MAGGSTAGTTTATMIGITITTAITNRREI
jgi:hypothetical protein